MSRKLILIVTIVVALASQGCVGTISTLTGIGILAAKGYFMKQELELKKDLQKKNYELHKLTLKMENN